MSHGRSWHGRQAPSAAWSKPMADGREDRPVIVASQFGNTTRCVEQARPLLERAGYEVLVFAAVGTGGRTMESLIESGMVAGRAGYHDDGMGGRTGGRRAGRGPRRLEAAARMRRAGHRHAGLPRHGELRNAGFRAREVCGWRFYAHNPQVTLMRTTPEECAQLGRILADKLNASTGPVTVLLPLRGISVISAPGQPFHDPVADEALFSTLKRRLRPDIPVIELEVNINDPAFAAACVETLLRRCARGRPPPINRRERRGGRRTADGRGCARMEDGMEGQSRLSACIRVIRGEWMRVGGAGRPGA